MSPDLCSCLNPHSLMHISINIISTTANRTFSVWDRCYFHLAGNFSTVSTSPCSRRPEINNVSAASHLLLTLCRRRRKAQAELCLAFDRRNSEYRLENSMSPSCLRRSGPADSSCLETHTTVVRCVLCTEVHDAPSLTVSATLLSRGGRAKLHRRDCNETLRNAFCCVFFLATWWQQKQRKHFQIRKVKHWKFFFYDCVEVFDKKWRRYELHGWIRFTTKCTLGFSLPWAWTHRSLASSRASAESTLDRDHGAFRRLIRVRKLSASSSSLGVTWQEDVPYINTFFFKHHQKILNIYRCFKRMTCYLTGSDAVRWRRADSRSSRVTLTEGIMRTRMKKMMKMRSTISWGDK